MKVCLLTSLWPLPDRPHEGLFAERRWKAMQERGHSVRVVHPLPHSPGRLGLGPASWRAIARAPRREQREGIAIERPRYWHLPGDARKNARRFAACGLRRVLSGARPDVLVCDYAWPAAAAAQAARAAGLAVVVSGRGSDVLLVRSLPALRDELAAGLAAAGHWCGVSADLVRAMDELGGAPGRGVLVPNGVDLGRFRPGDRAAARARLGWQGEDPLVLVVGHLIERKDPLLAARAFAAGAPPEARLLYVGRGPLEASLRRELARLGIAPRAALLGERPPRELADWYTAADLLLLTSTREGRPNVVLEALAAGRPVLATPAGGTAELLSELPECLGPSRDPAALGARLCELLRHPPPPERLRAAVQPLSWPACAERLEGCLAAAIEAAADPRRPETA